MHASDPASTSELTDEQLDTLLDSADQELLRHIQANTEHTAAFIRLPTSWTNAETVADPPASADAAWNTRQGNNPTTGPHHASNWLAQLTYDSLQAAKTTLPTRAEPASIRALTFTSARLTIELEVTDGSVLGQIVPAQPATIEIQTEAGDVASELTKISTDEIGCFSLHRIPRTQFRLRCRVGDDIDILTEWISI